MTRRALEKPNPKTKVVSRGGGGVITGRRRREGNGGEAGAAILKESGIDRQRQWIRSHKMQKGSKRNSRQLESEESNFMREGSRRRRKSERRSQPEQKWTTCRHSSLQTMS